MSPLWPPSTGDRSRAPRRLGKFLGLGRPRDWRRRWTSGRLPRGRDRRHRVGADHGRRPRRLRRIGWSNELAGDRFSGLAVAGAMLVMSALSLLACVKRRVAV